MIVERRTHRTKQFCEQAAIDLIKECHETFAPPNAVRIYRSISGQGNAIYQEFEFVDWQEREQYWADFFALPQMPEWIERWKELTETGGSTEFYRLSE
jgi:hypothetical protein